MKKPAAKKTTAVKHPFTAAHKREDKIRRLRRELRAAEHSPASPKKTVKVVKAAKKPRAWSPDGDLPVCSARAVAEALRLAVGVRLADEDVLGLHWAAGGDREHGVTVLDALSAVSEYGLPGWRLHPAPLALSQDGAPLLGCQLVPCTKHGSSELRETRSHVGCPLSEDLAHGPECLSEAIKILGVDLGVGSHAITVAPDGTWWSWGEPYDCRFFDGAVIEEAWAVTW
jgi:hypothetical protein